MNPTSPPFDPVDPKQSFPDLERGLLEYWREEDTFKRSIKNRQPNHYQFSIFNSQFSKSAPTDSQTFSFYDGPPFATGLPHYGHLLAGTVKDVIPRYQTMRGKSIRRRFGWDCHGLPIENLIEKEHDIKDKKEIEERGIAWFNGLCRDSVQRYTKEWREVVSRMGRWVDMDDDYKTMDPEYMESIWWACSQLHNKKLLYEGKKSMHVCPRCVTALSNFEVTLGYEDVTDHSITAQFELIDDLPSSGEGAAGGGGKTYVLAWTTTGWTLPGNLFLAVNPDVTYVQALALVDCMGSQNFKKGDRFILAKKIAEEKKWFERNTELHGLDLDKDDEAMEPRFELECEFKGKDLIGKHYEPLFPYFAEQYKDNAFRIVEGDFVTTEDGTGVVHIAPGFGSDDYAVGQREGVETLSHVNMDGTFIDALGDLSGEDVKPLDDPTKTDKKIAKLLDKEDKLFAEKAYKHSYPHCWRCDSPLINYALSAWFVAVEEIKKDLLDQNARTRWVPAHVRNGRFGKWLENARDWCISRNRYWGTPLPVWHCEETGDVEVIGSRDTLMAKQKIRFTKVTALRHAESEGNVRLIYQSAPPGTSLTSEGKRQAKDTAKHLKKQNVAVIYTSPLARCQQTAQIVAKATGATVVVDDRLREIDFGDYEGKHIDLSDPAFLKELRRAKWEKGKPESIYHFDGMETWEDTFARIKEFYDDVLQRHRGDHIAVVSHADPLIETKHFFTGEDPVKLSHQPFPQYATATTYFWDHDHAQQMDLHREYVDDITWGGSKTDQSVEVTMVRHGETDWNAEGRVQGWQDTELNDNGRAQAQDLANSLRADDYDVIITSDLKRATETAEILSKGLNLPIAGRFEELRERGCGDWEKRVFDEILEQNPHVDPAIRTITFHHQTGDGGESISDFMKRTVKARERILRELPGKRVLLVSHGGTMRAMLTLRDNLTYLEAAKEDPKNAGTLTMRFDPQMKRIPDVLDCWVESGSMPYAQEHFPFEPGHRSEPPNFPADFISENLDQTRGWFYTLMVLSTALFKKPAFWNCICGGIILAEDGKKMSKRLKNYPDPLELMDTYGADALRFALMSSPVVRAESLRFSDKPVAEVMRNVLLPLWNSYSFFVTYANAANFTPTETRAHSDHPLDRWMRSEVQDLVNRMTEQLDAYDLSAACGELDDTIDALTNWYVRQSRRRFAGKDGEEAQLQALHTLYDVLLTFSQVLCPFCPFITEAIYLNLIPEDHGSIHLTDWPQSRELSQEEQSMITQTGLLRSIVSLGMKVRSEANVKVRQPLATATIALPPAMTLSDEERALLAAELNVKDVDCTDDPESLAEVIALVDARKVGPRLGSRVQDIIAKGKAGEFTQKDNGQVLIGEESFGSEEVQIEYRSKGEGTVAADKGIVVHLDTTVSEELQSEGLARDLIRAVQKLRKDKGLEFTDSILLNIEGVDSVVKDYNSLIEEETRSTLTENKGEKHEMDLGGGKVTVRFEKR